MIDVKFEGLKELEKALKELKTTALPHAARGMINGAALEAQKIWRNELPREFHQNTPWNARRVQVELARGNDIDNMKATVGSTSPLAGSFEQGGAFSGKSAHVPIPGPVAAGEAAGSHRSRPVMPSRKLARITAVSAPSLARRARHRANAIAMAMAKKKGQKFALLQRPSGGQGLFLVGGGKRRMTARLVWDVSRSSVTFQPHPTLARTIERLEPELPAIAQKAIDYQLQRLRIGK